MLIRPLLIATLIGITSLNAVESAAMDDLAATVITSDSLEMISGSTVNRFFFTGSVIVTGNNLKATCDEMEVVSRRVSENPEPEGGTIGQIGSIERIILKGNVVIQQAGRDARAGHAEILPIDGRVVLTENPVVTDAEGTVSGYRMELVKGERVARVFGAPEGGQRPRVTLPTLPDLGYESDGSDGGKRGGQDGR